MIIVKIGGCNGSGKTSVVRSVLKTYKCTPIMAGKRPEAYVAKLPSIFIPLKQLVVLGSYENVCGGMDTISDKEDRLALLAKYSVPGNLVIYEGLITGKTYGAMGAISELPEHFGKWLYTFMDTPFETCVKRVLARRAAAGNATPFDPERTMRPTYKAVESTARRAEAQGHRVYRLNHTLTPDKLSAALMREVERMFGGKK